MAYLEATATIYHDEKVAKKCKFGQENNVKLIHQLISHILFQLLIEVDYLKNMDGPFIQIKGSNKEAVAAAGLALNLEGTYTTMVIYSKLRACLIFSNLMNDEDYPPRDLRDYAWAILLKRIDSRV